MSFNIGHTGVKTSSVFSRNIRAYSRHPALETKGVVKVDYVVQERDYRLSPDKTGIAIQSPFALNVFLTKRAAEMDLIPQTLAFFVCPQTYRIALDSGVFHYSYINQRIPFEIDAQKFTGEFYSGGAGPNAWHISLYTASEGLLGEMRGSSFAYNDLQLLQKYAGMAKPF